MGRVVARRETVVALPEEIGPPAGHAAGTAQDRRFRSTRLDIRCAAPEGIVVITDTVAPDPGGGRNYRLAVSLVSSPQTPDIVNGIRPGAGPAAVPALRPPGCRDPWLRVAQPRVMTAPLAGQPGHGRTTFVRRQPARIMDGRVDGGYTGVFELICPSCGDHPYLDYAPRSRRGCNGSAGHAPWRPPWTRITSTSGHLPAGWGQSGKPRLSVARPALSW